MNDVEFRATWCEILTPRERARNVEMSKAERRKIKRLLLKDEPLGEFEIHHIIPMQLGGADRLHNLVACERGLHRDIHAAINEQIKHLHPPDITIVQIPVFKGFVWKPEQLNV
jgi:hypothetical protein